MNEPVIDDGRSCQQNYQFIQIKRFERHRNDGNTCLIVTERRERRTQYPLIRQSMTTELVFKVRWVGRKKKTKQMLITNV